VAWDWFVEPDMVVVVVKVRVIGMVLNLNLVVVRAEKRRRDCMLESGAVGREMDGIFNCLYGRIGVGGFGGRGGCCAM
jgi:hypothetical protein